MAFDGNGNFVRIHNWTQDASNAIDINAGEMDGEDNGFAGGLSICVTRDGQGKMAADFTPATDNIYNLGTASRRWVTVNQIPIVPLSNFAGDIRAYGAVTGTDCAAAVTSAAAANQMVIFPRGAWPMSSTPTVPADVVLAALPGSSFSGGGAAALSMNISSSYQYNLLLEADAVGAAFRSVHSTAHSYGGSAMTGGRNSLAVQSSLNATSSASNANRNYVAGLFEFNGNANDNGTNPTAAGTSAGAGFGLNPVAILGAGATCWLNVSGMEVNVACQAGSSVYFRSGIQIAELPSSAVQGAIYDGALCIGNQGGIGWQNGVLFNNANGGNPVTTTGNLIATQGAATVANGVNFTTYTFSGQAFASKGFAVQGGGTEVDYGLVGTSNTYLMNFHTGATAAPNFDSRIVALGGNGTNGGGGLQIQGAALGFFTAAPAAQPTGYGTPTGGSHQGSFAAGSISLANLAAGVAQLIVDLKSLGLIGA
jgi:hypothetical protein